LLSQVVFSAGNAQADSCLHVACCMLRAGAMKCSGLGWVVAIGLAQALVGCGSSDSVGQGRDFEVGGSGGAGGSADEGGTPGSHPTTGAGAMGTSSSAHTSGAGAGSSSSSSSHTSSSSTGGGTCDFSASNDCGTATEIDSIAGDQGQDIRTVNGSGSQWLKVFVSEANGGGKLTNLRYTVALQSPSGKDYGLVVHVGDGTEPGCSADGTNGAGTPEMASFTDTDIPITNQGKWIGILVDYISGTQCGPSAEWSLEVIGNYAPSCQTDGMCTTSDD